MNKRIRNKKIKQRYIYGINLLSWYAELPKSTVILEVKSDLWEIAADLYDEHNDLEVYLDCKAIDLMWKYGTGWAGRDKVDKLISETMKSEPITIDELFGEN